MDVDKEWRSTCTSLLMLDWIQEQSEINYENGPAQYRQLEIELLGRESHLPFQPLKLGEGRRHAGIRSEIICPGKHRKLQPLFICKTLCAMTISTMLAPKLFPSPCASSPPFTIKPSFKAALEESNSITKTITWWLKYRFDQVSAASKWMLSNPLFCWELLRTWTPYTAPICKLEAIKTRRIVS